MCRYAHGCYAMMITALRKKYPTESEEDHFDRMKQSRMLRYDDKSFADTLMSCLRRRIQTEDSSDVGNISYNWPLQDSACVVSVLCKYKHVCLHRYNLMND